MDNLRWNISLLKLTIDGRTEKNLTQKELSLTLLVSHKEI